jgi:hypothetical protein
MNHSDAAVTELLHDSDYLAALIDGSEAPVKNGVSRCLIEHRGGRRTAYLKRLPLDEVAAEVFAARLLRRWGLPVPEPFVVGTQHGLAFASADAGAGAQSLRQHFFGDQPLAYHSTFDEILRAAEGLVLSLPTAPLVAAADEAIGNVDRCCANVLWNGAQATWIDHAESFGLSWLPDRNQVIAMAVHLDRAEQFLPSVLAAGASLDRKAPAAAAAGLPREWGADRMAAFVIERMTTLEDRLHQRIPQTGD